MDFNTYVSILVKFSATTATSAVLEFIMPKPAASPTLNSRWLQLIAGLFQLTLFVDVAPSLAAAIDPSTTENGDIGANIVFLLGLWFMPNMITKIMGWYDSLNLPAGGFSAPSLPDEK